MMMMMMMMMMRRMMMRMNNGLLQKLVLAFIVSILYYLQPGITVDILDILLLLSAHRNDRFVCYFLHPQLHTRLVMTFRLHQVNT